VTAGYHLPGLPRHSLSDGGKGLGLFLFVSLSLSASVIGGSMKRNKKETLCELCGLSEAGGE
jgi:hypothetical protein